MKDTGIIRKIDELGRIVIPMEIRENLCIKEKDEVEIFVQGENIVLRKYSLTCTFCESREETIEYKGKKICRNCIEKLKKCN